MHAKTSCLIIKWIRKTGYIKILNRKHVQKENEFSLDMLIF